MDIRRILAKNIILILLIISFYFLRQNDKNINIKENISKEKHKKNIISNENYFDKHVRILKESAGECTLFLNRNEEFPIDNPCSVLLLGSGARKTIKGGKGSGYVSGKFTTCEEGLEKSGFKITSKEWLDKSEYPFLKDNNEPKSDIAIYVLARDSEQGSDREATAGDVLLTDKEIKDILYLDKNFKKFILVLNVCGVVDLTPVRNVSNILLLSQLGTVTGDILSDIILGKQNPSGKLATTWSSLYHYLFINEFGDNDDTNYLEGIYVGYRFFNSFELKPLYPFGFGQSYTSFEISKISFTNIKDEIDIKVKVKNIGKYSGKEVVQIYVSPSQENIEKPYQSLVSFKKTKELKPSEEEEIDLLFKLRIIERYDEKKACYILDKGKYIIRVGNSSEDTKIYGYIELEEDIITQQLKNIHISDLGFTDPKPKIVLKDKLSNIQKIKLTKSDFDFKKIDYNYQYKIDDVIMKLKDEDLATLCVGDYKDYNEKLKGVGGLTAKDVKGIKHYIRMADGPAGLKMNDYSNNPIKSKKRTVALPIETALAQSFNLELIEQYGIIIGEEMEIFNIQLLLAPALNIHRNILCGRNFEYFSEDPLVTGKMAAAIVKVVQSFKNKGATLKHYLANNQETNKYNSNSKISERALREIYLKGFQIAIEESHPYAIMTSYNLVNGLHPSQNKELVIDVLRDEWNFNGLIMTDWSITGMHDVKLSKYPAQNVYENIKGGTNIMMPGSPIDYNILIEKLNQKELSREDLLHCASKVYEITELLNQ